ncbi:hypothetical protein C8R43DRAFT_1208810 [Mycena crocata]|nr:hypothetical protein C8R43DRAFT_1208810 [Mycena crocata]
MHPCLQTLDTVAIVFSHLDPAQAPRYGCRTLSALSRTCLRFRDPALDVLWREQTLENILKCLPDDVFVIAKVNALPGYLQRLRRPIVSEDWQRPRFYAHRVRELVSGEPSRSLSHILPMICEYIPAGLFPNLRGLSWTSFAFDSSYIPLFINPRMESIRLNFSRDCSLAVLPTLAQQCPDLRHVVIDDERSDSIAPLSTFVTGLTSIQSISITRIDRKAFHHLGRSHSLISLRLNKLPPVLIQNADRHPFSRLQRLEILPEAEIHPATLFFGASRSIPLASITMHFSTPLTAFATSDFYSALAAGCPHGSLVYLNLTTTTFEDPLALDCSIPSTTLRTLFCFTNLTYVRIVASVGFDLEDGAVSDLALAWPHVEYLELTSCSCPVRSRVTLLALRSLAQYCPRLKHLDIVFDASAVPTTDNEACQMSLTTLHASLCSITASLPVAHFLSAIFPNLASISTDVSDYDEVSLQDLHLPDEDIVCHRLWMEVESLL